MGDKWDWAKTATVSSGQAWVTDQQLSMLSGLERTTALSRATKALDEAAARHPELGGTVSEVKEGADEIFWRDYGDKALYHHWREGTHLLGGLILDRYRNIGGAMSSGLGAPQTSEVWADPVSETMPDGKAVTVKPVMVRFTEGSIAYAKEWGSALPEDSVRVTRPLNSKCTVRWDFEIIQQRSGNDWHDEDWLCAVWMVNGTPHSKTVQLKNRTSGEPELHGRPENPSGRTPIASIEDYVVCNRHDVVTVHYTVVNLSGVGYEEQLAEANRLTRSFLEWFTPKYAKVAELVLTKFIPGLAPVFAGINGAFPGYQDKLATLAGEAWGEVGAPTVKIIVAAIEELLVAGGKRANCSGAIMHDYVVFAPMAPVSQAIDKTYTADRAVHCQTPETRVNLTMTRVV